MRNVVIVTILLMVSAVAPLLAGLLFVLCEAVGLTTIEL